MPREGFTAITVSDEVYEMIRKFIDEENARKGYRRWRSISHFVEEALIDHIQSMKKEAEIKSLSIK